jgi:photosystem II stability/assembly factor-like uncharacterized protein
MLVVVAPVVVGANEPEPAFDPKLYQALEYRSIGPYRGGRVTAVSGVVGQRDVFYMGSTGGGVWKSADGGVTWTNISDEHFEAASVGAIAVAESDPNVVYVGMGSACVRGNISPGNGVYKSTDAGESWAHIGLPEAGQIGRIRVHPENHDLLYVAALGHIFGPNKQRGVFRSVDGGKSWEKILFVSDRAGAVDLAIDPINPRVVYASIWQVERKPWTLISGGEQGGLYKSKDGGDSWEELTDGLPQGIKGRIGVSVSAAKPGRVWALVEAEQGGLFRSEDGGKEFRLINPDRNFRQRAWYYTHVVADPKDANTVYILNVGMWRSHDGGESFEVIRTPHGDNHDLWINPADPQILIEGNDGGANVSYTGGETWSTQANQPTAEFYRVTVDGQFPYRVYGAQQDNSTVSVPSRTASSGITRQHWYSVAGCECAHIAVDPRNPNITYGGCYGGSIERHDHSIGQQREIVAYPQIAIGQAARDLRYRFQWNAPIRLSPHDPSVLYHCSQFVHRSTDEGQSWQIVSPDLSRNDGEKQDYAGGPITRDNTGVEVYGTIFAFEPSPHRRGLLWAGTDDGRVHVSRDDGASWEEITPKQMPDWGQVNTIELSPHDAGRAFLAVTRYKLDDYTPYIFRTDDFGKSWKLLTDGKNGIPAGHFVRVVREDPDRSGLLYAGTEFGAYVSFDDGKRWQSLQLELPVTPITDMAVTRQDLVVATQGRSFWILDDLTPLHQMSDEVSGADAFLFKPRDTFRFGGGLSFDRGGPAGKNPPGGALVHYALAEEPGEDEEVMLEILDAEGNVLRSFSSRTPERRAPNPWAAFFPEIGEPKTLPAEAGMNRFVWDLRLPDAELVDDAVLWGLARGPRVSPGTYQVRLRSGDWSQIQGFVVKKDPRLETTQEDFEAQFALARGIWQSLSESHRAIARLRDARQQVRELSRRLDEAGKGEGLEEAARRVDERLSAVEQQLTQMNSEAAQDILNFPPRLDGQLLGLLSIVESADVRPTDGSVQRFEDLRAEQDGYLAELRRVIDTDLAAFNDLVQAKQMPPVILPER